MRYKICLMMGTVCLVTGMLSMKLLIPEEIPIAEQINIIDEWHEALLSGDQKRITAVRHNLPKVSKAIWDTVTRHDDNRHGLTRVKQQK